MLTTSHCASARASRLGWNVRFPPTLTPLKKTTEAIDILPALRWDCQFRVKDYPAGNSGVAHDQHRVAELVAQIPADFRVTGGGEQGIFGREARQQRKVARARLVEAGQQAIHDPQRI